MFSTGTQRKFWNFSSLEELETLRNEANERFCKEHSQTTSFCLTAIEESVIRRGYEETLREFCARFQPPLPNSVVATAMVYFKRLFLHHSVMEIPIKDYMHTCLYMACKVDEYNITSRQYVSNLDVENRDLDEVAQDIIAYELRLMERLNFQLVVHTPYRQVEGFIIDIKTRCSDTIDAEKLRPGISSLLQQSLTSDVLLIYPPSQVALSVTIASATSLGMNVALDSFIANKLIGSASYELRRSLISQLQKIRQIIRKTQGVVESEFVAAKLKLSQCYRELNITSKSCNWKMSSPIPELSEQDVSMEEGGNFDDDDDDED